MAGIFQDTAVNAWGSTEYNQWVSSVVEGMAPVSDPEIVPVVRAYQPRYGRIPRATCLVCQGHANIEQYVLRSAGVAIDISALSHVRLGLIDSTDQSGYFDLTQTVSAHEAARNQALTEGEPKLVVSLGSAGIPAGTQLAPLIIYDSLTPQGVFMGLLDLVVVDLATKVTASDAVVRNKES